VKFQLNQILNDLRTSPPLTHCAIIAGNIACNMLHLMCAAPLGCFDLFQVIPQLYLNFQRKSTEGWSIDAIWMDFAGGVLSVVQMLLYCVMDGDNTQLTGNIPKLLLSCESLSIDTIFVFQHYILYPVLQRTLVSKRAADDSVETDDANKQLITHHDSSYTI